ncbi:protein PHYTOCHROME KINASE SUBSTRATE 3 [Heracleum sosnowskyi]|uniref:Protein PHYTOCHROME KINASE SUBSTRATE 3 n=1 Tax=Heracleum sosnowskyi TaxID=360622 RepID=A0AAD8H183_9APIA|nr:protein PHYTOCHROME KINASE SUBSTRATE 3 [Heracleum sosnowskyi]
MEGLDTDSNLRVASFSCYLSSKDENSIAGGIPYSSSPVMSPEETPRLINLGSSKKSELEFSVFAADKYFNTKKEQSNAAKYEIEKEKIVDIHLLQQKIRPKTPSISSEASSWNSQSVLLQSLHRNISQTKHRKGSGLKYFPFFSCQGSCSEKKAIHVNKSVDYGVLHNIQKSQPEPKMVEQFSFPVLNSGITNLKVDEQFKEEKLQVDPSRNSIEVFGFTKAEKRDNIAINMERKLSILTWDAIPKVQSLVTTSFGSSALCDDMASDASSDLFEIENISGIDHAVLSRQESCNAACLSPTTQYAPSEASIEWSVVTASAADYSSVFSDYEDASVSVKGRMISGQVRNRNTCPKKVVDIKEPPKSGSSKLLGCRNHKAVRVAESTHRTNEKFER